MTTTLPTPAPTSPPEPDGFRDPDLLAERGWREFVGGWGLVLLALLGDLAAFYIVLAVLFQESPIVILAAAVGFAAGAIVLSHSIGKGLAGRRCHDPRAHTALLAATISTWLLLGLAAFLARYGFGPEREAAGGSFFPTGAEVAPEASGDGAALMAASLFGALYLASGLGAIYVSYRWYNPLAEAYARATRRLGKAVATEATSRAEHVRAEHVLYQHEQEHERERERWEAARRQALSLSYDLQNYARTLMAIATQDPPATDGLTGRGPRPLDDHPAHPVLEGDVVLGGPDALPDRTADGAVEQAPR